MPTRGLGRVTACHTIIPMRDRRDNMAWICFTLVVVAVVAIYVWRHRSGAARPLTDTDLAVEMQSRATQAVETAASEYGIAIDYSADSVAKVEEILGRIHEQHEGEPLPEKQLVKESLKWGGYIGEVIRRMKRCHWELHSKVGGEGSFPIVFENEAHETFPVRWCYKRISNGPEDNVWHKFSLLVVEGANLSNVQSSRADRTD